MEVQVRFWKGLAGVAHVPDFPPAADLSPHSPDTAPGPVRFPGVILFHGFTGNKAEEGRIFVRLGRALAARGIATLRFDFRGSGDSGGEFSEATLASEVEDAQAAIAWWTGGSLALAGTDRPVEVDRGRLGLLGVSLGSVVAQLVAPSVDPKALVLWATIARPAEVFKTDLGAASRGYGAQATFLAEIRQAQPLASLAAYGGPLLCVHGEKDFVPSAYAEEATALERKGGASSELVVIEGGAHTFGTHARQAQAISCTRDFFARHLANLSM